MGKFSPGHAAASGPFQVLPFLVSFSPLDYKNGRRSVPSSNFPPLIFFYPKRAVGSCPSDGGTKSQPLFSFFFGGFSCFKDVGQLTGLLSPPCEITSCTQRKRCPLGWSFSFSVSLLFFLRGQSPASKFPGTPVPRCVHPHNKTLCH